MNENERPEANPTRDVPASSANSSDDGLRSMIREVIGEYVELQKTKAEPAFKAELQEERRRREGLERRLNELVDENLKARQRAEEAERTSAIRGELQRLGVAKLDLAFRAVKDEIHRNDQGSLVSRDGSSEVDFRDFLGRFVQENPELLPARGAGGSGASLGPRSSAMNTGAVELERIKPGMDPEEMDRIRKEISRIASQSLHGT